MKIILLLLFTISALHAAEPIRAHSDRFDPRTYGAKGDGVTFDTEAIQRAINDCAGTHGSVVLAAGTYLTRPLELRGGMTLHLDKGAVLLGSPDIADYPVRLPEPPVNVPEKALCRSLLYAVRADRLTLEGEGVMDGNCQAMNMSEEMRKFGQEKDRPSLLRVFQSGHVTVRGITLRNPCMWTQIYSECDHLLVEGITVDAPPDCGNLDGIDVCDSNEVIIRGCTIRSEDDSICLKSMTTRGLRNVLVENNTVHCYRANGIKLGTATKGPVSGVVIRNNRITYAKYGGLVLASVDGSHVKDVRVENLEIHNVGQPIFIRLGNRGGLGSMDGISIDRLTARATNPENGPACVISGIPGTRIRNVRITNSRLEMPGGLTFVPRTPPEKENAYPQSSLFWNTPGYAFFVRHAEGIVLQNVSVSTLAPDARPWLDKQDAEVTATDCKYNNQPLPIAAGAADSKPTPRFIREGTEWVTTWLPGANSTDQPHVLLVGDSITKGYGPEVAKRLQGTATCGHFTTSACVADPAFDSQLQSVLTGYRFAVIHFNNGLHGFGYTDKEYQAGYEQALKTIRRMQPGARLILTLSTPMRADSEKAELNPRVNARNALVRELAKEFGAEIDDLHAISDGHTEYYIDPYHYKPDAIQLQAAQVAKKIQESLPK